MLSEDALLDEQLVRQVLQSGHSRLPVYRWAKQLFFKTQMEALAVMKSSHVHRVCNLTMHLSACFVIAAAYADCHVTGAAMNRTSCAWCTFILSLVNCFRSSSHMKSLSSTSHLFVLAAATSCAGVQG
jgi:FtsH-binding integral membrane protein